MAAEALRLVGPEQPLAEMGHSGLAPLLRVSGEALRCEWNWWLRLEDFKAIRGRC